MGCKHLIIQNGSYWDVKEINENTLFITLKNEEASKLRGIVNKLVLHFYGLKIGRGYLSIPISPLQAKFYFNRSSFYSSSSVYFDLDKLVYFKEDKIDFKQFVFPFPFFGIIEHDFSKGIMFEFKKHKDKIKLIKLLDQAYKSLLKI